MPSNYLLKFNKYLKSCLVILLFIIASNSIIAQSFPGWFAIYLNDKNQNQNNLSQPELFLSTRAIENRMKNMIEIDSTDLPVSKIYINQLQNFAFCKYSSKWQNSVLLKVDDSLSLDLITKLPFVKSFQYLAPFTSKKIKLPKSINRQSGYETGLDSFPDYGKSKNQLDLIGLTPLHHNNLFGKNVLISIHDAGFRSANKMKSFEHIFLSDRVIIAQDIVQSENDIYSEDNHGTHVLSTIAAKIKGEYYGCAPEASFMFLRTEDVSSEYPLEEYFWLVGAEISDSAGADIITSSLSYTQFDDSSLNYNHQMLDGKSTIISKAASTAAQKGILVVTSAGNDGKNAWRKIGFPSDGIDVITVGATDSLGIYASLSSQGYSADGRVKPNLVAVGKATALVSSNDNVFYGNGTSFSTPIIAGGLALLAEAHPTKSAAQIRDALFQSASIFSKPDSLMGFGLPDFFVADLILRGIPKNEPQEFPFQVMPNPFNSGFYIVLNPADSQDVKIEIFDFSGKIFYTNKLSVHPGVQAFFIGQISELANGIYVLKIETNGKVFSRKIVKHE
jgi:serine protease AprX